MSFQSDIDKYLHDELPHLQMRVLMAAGLSDGPVLETAGTIGGPLPVADKKEDNNPVDAWEPRICEDGVIIRGPPSEDTPPPRPSKE